MYKWHETGNLQHYKPASHNTLDEVRQAAAATITTRQSHTNSINDPVQIVTLPRAVLDIHVAVATDKLKERKAVIGSTKRREP